MTLRLLTPINARKPKDSVFIRHRSRDNLGPKMFQIMFFFFSFPSSIFFFPAYTSLDFLPLKMPRLRDLLRPFLDLTLTASSSAYLLLWILPGDISSTIHKWATRREYLPAVPRHTHPLCLCHPVEFGALFQILFAANALSIAETSFSESINVTPV